MWSCFGSKSHSFIHEREREKTCGVALALNLIHSFIHGREGEREGGGWGQEVLEFSFRREKEDLVITIII